MSRRPRGGGRKRSASQARQEEEMETQTQESQDGGTQSTGSGRGRKKSLSTLDEGTIERKVGEIVRYLLFAEKRKVPVKKSELIDKVVGSEYSAYFQSLMSLAESKLREVFGVSVEERTPKKKGKNPTTIRYYILTNQIAEQAREALLPCSDEDKGEKGLLFVILAFIMLKDGSVQEEHLMNMLSRLGIDCNSVHSQFGDVQNLIRKDLVEAKYLEREKTTVGDQYRYVYHWGPRADASVSKNQLLVTVAELHGDTPSRWEKQFAHMTAN